MPFPNRQKVSDVVLTKCQIQIRPFWSLGMFVELIRVVGAAGVKQGWTVHVHSLKHLFLFELALSVAKEDRVLSLTSSAGEAAVRPYPSPLDEGG